MIKSAVNFRPEVLEDELTKLIPLQESDFERLFAVASDPLIWDQHPVGDRYKRQVFKIFFDSAVTSGTAFLIFDKKSNELIGSTRYYDYKPDGPSVAIGYTFIARKYWGRMYNKSIKKLMIDYAFQFVDSIFLHIGAANIRSQKATGKLGAKKVKEIDFDLNGRTLPHYEYELKKNDWLL